MARSKQNMLPVHPHLLVVGLGVSVTLALAVALYTPMPRTQSLASINNVDNSYAAATATPPPSTPRASATPCPTSCQVISLAPMADARVKRVEPNENFGSAVELRAENDASGSYYESYLKFDLSFIPPTATVKKAELTLHTIDESKNGPQLYQVANTFKNTTTPWTESGLTWNNKPAKVGSSLGNKAAVVRDVYVTYDVTALVNKSKGQIYSFGLFADSTDGLVLSSKENGVNWNIPYMTVNF